MPISAQANEGLFSGDYADPRTPEQRAEGQRAACRQAAGLARQRKDHTLEHDLINSLQRRRAERQDLVQFDVIEDNRRGRVTRTLVVRGEMLAEAATLEHEGTRRFLERFKLSWEPIECLEGRVGRLKNNGIDAHRYADLARLIRGSGFSAGVNHITPLGPIMKNGDGSAEPTGAAVAFPPRFAKKFDRPTVVALIDTGITDQVRADGWLDVVTRTDNVDLLDDIPAADGFLDFGAGHGTFAAGVVQQVAPDADLRVYKAIDSDGIGSEVAVACAMVRAVEEGAQILNLSLGTQTVDDQPLVAIGAALDLINERTKGEVMVVAAAGNDGSRRPCWPAAFRSVVSVAGLTSDMAPTVWSNRGFWVTCSTVGEGLLSPYPKGAESFETDPQPDTFPADAWALWTGTSFAAPQIAGAVARLADERSLSPREALKVLLGSGTAIPDFGVAVRILPGT
ncbi:MAG: S8/S53 family peptidase [Actinomycetota bacterium]